MGSELRQDLVINTQTALTQIRNFFDEVISGLRRAFTGTDSHLTVDTAQAEAAITKLEADVLVLSNEAPVIKPIVEGEQATAAILGIEAKVGEMDADLAKPLKIPPIEVPPIPPVVIPPIEPVKVPPIPPVVIPPIEPPDISGLTSGFNAAVNELRTKAEAGRGALAAMIVAGEEGTPAFQALAAAVSSDVQELDRYQSAAHKAAAATTEVGESTHGASEHAHEAHGPFHHLKELFAEGLSTGVAILGVQGLGHAIEGAFEKFEVQEKAEIGLEAAYRNTGKAGEKAVEDLKKFASARQGVTTFGDEETLKVLQFGKSLGGITDTKKLEAFAIAVQDVSSATGQSMEAVSLGLAAKLEAGGKDRKLGIKFEAGETEKNVDKFIDAAQRKFGGLADDIGKTPAAGVAKFKNAFGDMQEVIGKVLISILGPIAPALQSIAELVGTVLSPIGASIGKVFEPIAGVITAVLTPIVGLIAPIAGLVTAVFTPIIHSLGVVAAAFGPVIGDLLVPFGLILSEVGDIVASILTPALDLVTSMMVPMIQYIGMIDTMILTWISVMLPLVKIALIPLTIILQVVGQVMNALLPPIIKMAGVFEKFAVQLMKEFTPVINQITKLFEEQGAIIAQLISGVLVLLINTVINMVEKNLKLVASLFGVKSASDLFALALQWVQKVVIGVVSWIMNLRAEIAGVSAAMSFAIGVFSEFIDAITSLDIDKAKHSFDNFFERLGEAYKKGKEEFFRSQEPIETPEVEEHGGEDHPPPPPPPPPDKKEALRFDSVDLDKDKRLAAQRALLDEEADQIKKILLKEKFDIINADLDAQNEIDKIRAKAAEARKKGDPVDNASLEKSIQSRRGQAKLGEEQARYDAVTALKATIPKYVKELTDTEIAALQEQTKTITGVSESEIRRRGDLMIETLRLQQNQIRSAIIEKIPGFQNIIKQLTDKVQLGKMDSDDIRRTLEEIYEFQFSKSEELKNLRINQERALLELKKQIEEEAEVLRIERIGDRYEREYARAVLDAQRKLRLVLVILGFQEQADRESVLRKEITAEQFADNERQRNIRRVQETIDATLAMAKAQREYLEKTDFWYRASVLFRDSLDEFFLRKKQQRNQKELSAEKAKLDLEENFLKEKLQRDLINYIEYTNQLASLAQARLKSDVNVQFGWAEISKGIQEKTVGAFTKLSEGSSKMSMESSVKYAEMKDHRMDVLNKVSAQKQERGLVKDLADKEAAKETDNEINKERAAAYAATALALSAGLVSFATEGGKIFGQYSAMILDVSFKSLQAMIPGWILGAFGSSVDQLGPIAGPLAAAGIIGVLYGLLSIAESAMTGGNFRDGGKVTGGRQRILVNDDPQSKPEYVVQGEATEQYEPTLHAINRRASIDDILRTLLPHVDMQAVWSEASSGYGPGVQSIVTPVNIAPMVMAVDPVQSTRMIQQHTASLILTSNQQNARESALLRGKVDVLVRETRKVVQNTKRPRSKRSSVPAGAALW